MHLTPLPLCKKLLQSGYSLLTVGTNKRPNGPWKALQTKPYTPEEFEQRYYFTGDVHSEATQGIGLVCGYNGLEVVDVDLKVFPTLPEQQAFWEELLAFLRDNIDDFDLKFVIYKTRNQGYHILYRCEQPAGNSKLATLKGHTGAVIETRGAGGYVFVYDNRISKLGYSEIQRIDQRDRDTLWQICRTFHYISDEAQPDDTAARKTAKEYTGEQLTPWADYNRRHTWSDVVGDEFKVIRQLSTMTVIRRHGADSPHSGYVYRDSGGLFLFTTGTRYPHERLLFPFHLFAYRYHNGDFKAAASDLYAQGYGTRKAPAKPPVPKRAAEVEEEPAYSHDDAAFPLDIFPPDLVHYMKECERTLRLSPDYMGAAMLWMMSVIVGNSIRVRVKAGWEEIVAVWIAVVGKPGYGKTPSIDAIIRPLIEQNNREVRQYIERRQQYEQYEKLTKEEKKNHELVPEPTKSQFIVNDITLEALVDLHQDSYHAVGVFKDELNGWFKDMNRYRSGSDLEFWLSAWSGKPVAFNRLTRASSFVDRPLIPVLGGVQPGVLNAMFTDENKDNGFIDRMLLAYPDVEAQTYNEAEIDPALVDWYRQTVAAMYAEIRHRMTGYDQQGQPVPYHAVLSPEAKTLWVDAYNEISGLQNSDNENEYTKSMLPKQTSYIARFAMLLHVLDVFCRRGAPDEYLKISGEAMRRSVRLSRYFIAMAKKVRADSVEVGALRRAGAKANTPRAKFEAMYEENPKLNRAAAAELLGVSRKTVFQWINELKA